MTADGTGEQPVSTEPSEKAGARTLRVLDMINTDKSAKELLDHRVAQVNATGRYVNDIYCSGGEYVERLRAGGHTVYVVETPRGLSPWPLIRSVWHTRRLLRRQRYDVIHTHGSVIWFVGAVAALFMRGTKVVAQIHGFHHHENMSPLTKRLYIWFQRFLALLSDVLTFQNQADIEECLRTRIAPVCKLVLVGNGAQLDGFPVREPPENDPPRIVCVARFEPVKNHQMILETARELAGRGVRFELQLIGDGDTRPACEAWVAEHGLSEQVRFLGYRDDVPELTAGADLCTLVSLKEGLPRAIIEAAACARPIVATDVIGNRDSIIDGQTGILVPLNDASAMADKIQELLADPDLRRRIGDQARQYAEQQFDERRITERIIGVYDQLTQPK